MGITQINPQWETTKTFAWRFLNPARVSVLDVDVDIEGGRRKQVLDHLRKVYGEDRVANVATFGTEKSKSAILTACRGLGIDVDIAQYMSSLIPQERGFLWSMKEVVYGDEEKGRKPVKQFIHEVNQYPGLLEIIMSIEGLVNKRGIHASGAILYGEDPFQTASFMKAPNGKPTNLTERQWLQVRTQDFIGWFGDWINDPENASKVIDENGEPLIVYHGGQANINVFLNMKDNPDYKNTKHQGYRTKNRVGIYFSKYKDAAVDYASQYNKKERFVYEVFLNIRNNI